MGGHVVHARHGDRSCYRPWRSQLSDSSQPLQVVDALMRLHPFKVLYIADLDAILGRGHHGQYLRSIGLHYPDLALWLDAGLRDSADIQRCHKIGRDSHLVIGSESLSDARLLRDPALTASAHCAALSLDFHGDRFLGPPELLTDPALWPRRVIVMTLARVGGRQGPDLNRLRQLIALSPKTLWYAGGGVRDAGDLRALSALGVHGALVATALHTGAIGASVLNTCA